MEALSAHSDRSTLLVLASTYPRWEGDPEPGFVHELAKRLTGRFRVIALVPHSPAARRRETLDGIEVIRYRYAPEYLETLVNDGGIVTNLRRARWKYLLVPSFILAQAWKAWRLIRQEKIDVIHAHWLLPQGLIAAALQSLPGPGVPFVVTSHGADLYALTGRLFDAAKRFVAGRASAVTVVSTAMRRVMVGLDVKDAKISVLPMGVDLEHRFSPDAGTRRSEREILFVGRLVEKKGVCHLLDAMPAVLRRYPDAFLTIAGFGPEEEALKTRARALGLESCVHFLGAVPQPDLPALYRRASLFVAPFVRARSGDEEGLGLVLVEAVGCGCPIIAGRVPALHEVLGDGFDDMAVDPKDTRQLADRIIGVLADPATAAARATQLRSAIGKRLDWNEIAARYSGLLSMKN